MAEVDRAPGSGTAWVSHPARHQPGRGLALGGLIIVLGVALGLWMRSGFWGIFAAGVLFLSLESFFLPTRYELGEKELSVRRVFSASRNPWEAFRRVYRDRHGLTLSPFRRRTFLEPYRASRVLFDGADAEAVCAAVRRLCPGADWVEVTKGKASDVADRPG
jgi:hypothetical protein